jgi:hypothetical protein
VHPAGGCEADAADRARIDALIDEQAGDHVGGVVPDLHRWRVGGRQGHLTARDDGAVQGAQADDAAETVEADPESVRTGLVDRHQGRAFPAGRCDPADRPHQYVGLQVGNDPGDGRLGQPGPAGQVGTRDTVADPGSGPGGSPWTYVP